MRLIYLALVVTLGLAGCAEPLLAPPPLETLTEAQRASLANYPADAKSRGVPGLVLVMCTISPQRRLHDCEVDYESLPGWGFGAAGLRTVDSVSPDPTVPVGATVAQWITFCNTEGGCNDMRRLGAQLRERIARDREAAGLPPVIRAPGAAAPMKPGAAQ